MSLVPELSRRAALRLGASAVAGAAGMDPRGIKDPEKRAQYEEAIRENRLKKSRNRMRK